MPLAVRWIDAGRKPQYDSDPRYPNGGAVDASDGADTTCQVALPYPAPQCGAFVVECPECGARAVITTAGRADDPVSVRVACLGRTVN